MSLNASVGGVADDLAQYGEDETSKWIETCTDLDFVRVCNCAEFLLYQGPQTKSGTMLIAKALAIGAVYIYQGVPRQLARSRRDTKRRSVGSPGAKERRTSISLLESRERYDGVGEDFLDYWAESPSEARAHIATIRKNFPPKSPLMAP